jgi:hypothetical protein
MIIVSCTHSIGIPIYPLCIGASAGIDTAIDLVMVASSCELGHCQDSGYD